MNQFGKILKFELKNYLTNKIFIGVTIFLVVAIAAVMFFPRIKNTFVGSNSPDKESDRPVMIISSDQPELETGIQTAFQAAFGEYEVQISEKNLDEIKEEIMNGDASCAFVIKDITSYEYYVNNLSMYDSNTFTADEVLQNIYRIYGMTEKGISPSEAQSLLSMQISHETFNLGKDQARNFFYTYIMIFALYMVILLYGQMVATNVATEKSSRTMEVLITSAKPVSMMFGKVLASCLAGLFQIVAVFGSALIFFHLNQEYWDGNGVITSMFDMPLQLFGYMLIFFVLGFLVYAFLFGAIGSTASKLEDINTSVMPVTMLFIIAFFVVIFSMTSGNIDNLIMKICSFVPFTSPMAMFTRIAMSTVPVYEIVISVGILIASVIGIGVLSAKIYRVGVLLYGTTPKLGSILKAIRKA